MSMSSKSQTQEYPIFINESQVKNVLTWELVNEAVEEALKSVCQSEYGSENGISPPFAHQPARNMTPTGKDKSVLLTMPGFIGNYKLSGKKFNTLGCKLVTMAKNNENLNPQLPNILANIMLFDDLTGKLKCVMEATEITAWRTASASVIATKYLYFKRQLISNKPIIAIIGCGVQGRSHALGMCHTFNFSEVRLYNRTEKKAMQLANELKQSAKNFVNKDIIITVASTIEEALNSADVIVTATFANEPIVQLDMLKSNVHINAVGAGVHHHSELSELLYLNSSVYVDNWASAKIELKNLKAKIMGEVGEVIIDKEKILQNGITVFQSMGMAVEDASVAQSVLEALKH